MKTIDFSKTGGFPFTQNSLDFLQTSYKELFAAIGGWYGNKTIITGMEVGGSSVAEGWFVYNNELIKFNACALATKVDINEVLTSVEFEDGLTKSVYKIKTAVCGATGAFDFSELVRLESYKDLQEKINDFITNAWRTYDVKQVDCPDDYITDNFNLTTGLGINERNGWAICDGRNGTRNRGGRVSVGYSVITVDPEDGVWDVLYNTIGATGGEKKHQLTTGELPRFNLTIPQGDSFTGGGGTRVGRGSVSANDSPTSSIGNDEAHENRQPFMVTLFIQKL